MNDPMDELVCAGYPNPVRGGRVAAAFFSTQAATIIVWSDDVPENVDGQWFDVKVGDVLPLLSRYVVLELYDPTPTPTGLVGKPHPAMLIGPVSSGTSTGELQPEPPRRP